VHDDSQEDIPPVGPALARLLGLLLDDPEAVELREEVDSSGDSKFVARAPDDELGKLIGRQGRTARSIRSFLDVRGELDGRRYELDIREF
jgi:hypothetical protein